MKSIFIMERYCAGLQKRRFFFARIFELYCQLIISGENEGRERTFTKEEENKVREREIKHKKKLREMQTETQ